MALALITEHPEWTIKKIAQTVGVTRRTLYNWETFQNVWKLMRAKAGTLPSGFRNANGDVEAIQMEEECDVCGNVALGCNDGRWLCRECLNRQDIEDYEL